VTLEKVEPAESVRNVAAQHKGQADETLLQALLEKHAAYTGSESARNILAHWADYRAKFVKVMPNEYKRALIEMSVEKSAQKTLEAA
jgi:glutamate synthase (NADPH/NADH) large chain